jgi:hypothetical protein
MARLSNPRISPIHKGCRRWLSPFGLRVGTFAKRRRQLKTQTLAAVAIASGQEFMNANHPLVRASLVRAALAGVAVPGGLALMACIVAALAVIFQEVVHSV